MSKSEKTKILRQKGTILGWGAKLIKLLSPPVEGTIAEPWMSREQLAEKIQNDFRKRRQENCAHDAETQEPPTHDNAHNV